MNAESLSSQDKNKELKPGGTKPSASFRLSLDDDINKMKDLRNNLGIENDKYVYDKIERDLNDRRNRLKGRLMDTEDPDYEYLNRSESRRNSTKEVLDQYTHAAGIFQQAQENNRVDRSKATDSIENLTYKLINLKHHTDHSSEK